MKKIAILSGIFLFACHETSNLDNNDFSVILQGEYVGKEEKTHELITNNNDFINAIYISFKVIQEKNNFRFTNSANCLNSANKICLF
jgi:hypothetical protein